MKTCKREQKYSFTEQDDGWTIGLAWMLEIKKMSQPGSKPQIIQMIA